MPKKTAYNGPERRIRPNNDRRCGANCFEHSGVSHRLQNVENKIEHLENEKFLTLANYRWTTGILLSILVSVLSATIYFTFQTGELLRNVQASQHTLSVQIGFLQADIEEIKKKVP